MGDSEIETPAPELTWHDARVLMVSFGPPIAVVAFVVIAADQHSRGAGPLDAGWVLLLPLIGPVAFWVGYALLWRSLPPEAVPYRKQPWPKKPPPRDEQPSGRGVQASIAATLATIVVCQLSWKLPPAVGIPVAVVVMGTLGCWGARTLPRAFMAAHRKRLERARAEATAQTYG